MSLRYDANGNLIDGVSLMGSNATDGQTLWTPGMLFNETTSDKPRGNTQGTLLASAARTASTNAPIMTNYNAKGIMLFLNITSPSGTGGLAVRISGIDSISGSWVFLNVAPTAILANGLYAYEIYPGSSAAGVAGTNNVNQRTSAVLPRALLAGVTHVDATSYTYSLGYSLIL